MGLSRPVAGQTWAGTTTTGAGSIVHFGEPVSKVSSLITNGTTKAVTATIQGSLGGSTGWVTLHTYTTGGTTGTVMTNSTAVFLVDKVRLNVSANASTAGAVDVWLAGA